MSHPHPSSSSQADWTAGWRPINPTVAAAKAQVAQMSNPKPSAAMQRLAARAAQPAVGSSGASAASAPSAGMPALPSNSSAPVAATAGQGVGPASPAKGFMSRKIGSMVTAARVTSAAQLLAQTNKGKLEPIAAPRAAPVVAAAVPEPTSVRQTAVAKSGIAPVAMIRESTAAAKAAIAKTAAGGARIIALRRMATAKPAALPANAAAGAATPAEDTIPLVTHVRPPRHTSTTVAPTSLPPESEVNYPAALHFAKAPKSVDVLLLSNPGCAALVQSVVVDLQRAQYVCIVLDESVLVGTPEPDRFAPLSSAHTLLWVMTSDMWQYDGCISAARHAAEVLCQDVALVRQDGAIWQTPSGNVVNYPPDEQLAKHDPTNKIFSSKAVEHVAPYYSAFIDKLIDRLGMPRVKVGGYVGATARAAATASADGASSLERDAQGLLRVLAECQEGHIDSAHTAVGTASLVMQRWVELYGEQSAWNAAAAGTPLSAQTSTALVGALLRHWCIFEKYDVGAVYASIAASQSDSDTGASIIPLTPSVAQLVTHLLWTLFTVVRGCKIEHCVSFYIGDTTRRIFAALHSCGAYGQTTSACFALLLQQLHVAKHANAAALVNTFFSMRGGELVRSAFLSHLDEQSLALHAILLLRSVLGHTATTTTDAAAATKDSLVALSGQVAYAALVRYPNDLVLQREGWILWATQPPANQMQLLRSGALSQAMLALQNHASDPALVRFMIQLLKSCVHEKDLARAVLQYGGVEGLLSAVGHANDSSSSPLLADVSCLLQTLLAHFGIDVLTWFALRNPVVASSSLAALAAAAVPSNDALSALMKSVREKAGSSWEWECPIPYANPLRPSAQTDVTSSDLSATPPAQAYKYDIFLSHHPSDSQDLIKALKLALEADGFGCFLDRGDDDASLLADLPRIVSQSRIFLAVASPGLVQSKGCAQEMDAAIKAGIPIVVVKQDGAHWEEKDRGTYTEDFPPLPSDEFVAPEWIEPLQFCREHVNGSSVLQHSSAYFPQFYTQLLSRLGTPRVLVDGLINGGKSLLENLQQMSTLFAAQEYPALSGGDVNGTIGAISSGERKKSDSILVACASNFVLLHRAGEWESMDCGSIESALWQNVMRCAVEQLKRSAFEARVRHVTTLLDLIGSLISLHRSVLLPVFHSTGVLRYICWLMRDHGLEPALLQCVVRFMNQLLAGGSEERDATPPLPGDNEQLKALDEIVRSMLGSLDSEEGQTSEQNTPALHLLLGALQQLLTASPPSQAEEAEASVVLGLKTLERLLSLAKAGSLPLSAELLGPALARAGFTVFLQQPALDTVADAQLISSLRASWAEHSEAAWFASFASSPVLELKCTALECPDLDAAQASTRRASQVAHTDENLSPPLSVSTTTTEEPAADDDHDEGAALLNAPALGADPSDAGKAEETEQDDDDDDDAAKREEKEITSSHSIAPFPECM